MTSTKTFYFTTVLRSVFTEQKVEGVGSQPAYDDIGTFDDFWNVRLYRIKLFSSYLFRIQRSSMDLFLMLYLIKNGTMEKT